MHDVIYNLNLVVSSVLVTVGVLFIFLFYREWRKQARSENEQYIPFALMILYLFLSIGFIMMTNSNYFIDPVIFETYIASGIYFYLIMSAAILIIGIFVYIAERIIPTRTRHFFIIYFGLVAASSYVFRAVGLPFFGFYILLLVPIWILMGLFAYHLIWKSSGQIRQKMLIVSIGYVAFMIAVFLMIRFILVSEYSTPFDPEAYTIPLEIKFIVLIGSILAGYGFYSIPSFTEFDWKDKIRHLYVLNLQGICLFQQSFKSGSIADQDLLGGSLMAINTLIKEIIQSDKTLRVIDQGDAKIVFETSPQTHINCVMVVDEDLYVIRHKLKELIRGFDLIFGDIMKEEWSGEIHIFRSLQPLVNRLFEIEN